jgi:hypothetical protein
VLVGLLPEAAPTVDLGGLLIFSLGGSFRVGASAHAALPLPQTVSVGSAAEGRFSAEMAGLDGCPLIFEGARLVAGLCAGMGQTWLSASGEGLSGDTHASKFQLAAEALGTASVRLSGPVVARLGASLDAPFTRDRFGVDLASGGRIEVHRSAPVLFASQIGIGLRLP